MKNRSPPGRTLCPDGAHDIHAAATAATGLLALTPAVRARLVQMLCEIADVAGLDPSAYEYWDETALLRLSAGDAVVLYSLNSVSGILVHHVIASERLRQLS
jgi:hypothetical protein